MVEKILQKINDRLLYGSKKDRRINELWNALNHLVSTIDVYGHMDWYEANPEWEPPAYLRNGEYTMEKRLKDIRTNSIQIRKAADKAQKVMFALPGDDEKDDI